MYVVVFKNFVVNDTLASLMTKRSIQNASRKRRYNASRLGKKIKENLNARQPSSVGEYYSVSYLAQLFDFNFYHVALLQVFQMRRKR